MFKLNKLNVAISVAFVSAAGLAGVASAQELQRVEVTGSNIKRTDAETASPVQVITRTEIERTGKATIDEVLQALPINNNGAVPTTFGNGFAAGGSGASLRGLSVNSTLVLLNGRRLAPYGLADDGQRTFADLSSIPLDLVERVEVLKDGASAIYGSDAIAGVINIILRKDYRGLGVTASAGTSRYNDANSYRASVTGGLGDISADNYNLFFNVEASHQDQLTMNQRAGKRDFIGVADTSPWGYDTLNTGLGMIRGYKLSGTSVSGSPTGWARAVSGPQGAVGSGAYTQLGGGTCVPTLSGKTFNPQNAFPACLWSVYDYLSIQPKLDKLNLLGRGTWNLNANTTAYLELSAFNSKVYAQSTPTSVSGAWVGGNGVVMNNSLITMGPAHPDNPFPGSYARLRYVTGDLGPRSGEYNTTVSRALAGLKGTAAGWDYDAGLLYTQSVTDIHRHGYVRNSVLQSALDGTGPYGYYRLGVNAGLNSPALKAALSPDLANRTKTSVTSLDVKASRELMQMAGGAMGIAAGAELRQEKLDSPATPYTDTGDIIGLGYSAFNQKRNVFAAYTELLAPVMKGFELSGAIRVDRYSDWGTAVTPKLGAKWTVVPQFVVRGSYAEGFRAPGAAESGNSSVSAFTSYVDPIRCPGGTAIPGATPGTDCGGGTTSVFSIGNKGIKPEKSQSYNLGLVFEPSKNFNVSLDFWQIVRKNEIIGADVQAILNNPAGYPGAVITRDSTTAIAGVANSGTLLSVSAPYMNGPKTTTNGADLDMRFRLNPNAMGMRFFGGANATYVNKFQRVMPDGTVLDYAGTYGPTALSSSAGMPRTRFVVDLGVEKGPVTVTGRVNYTSGIAVIESQQDQTCLAHTTSGTPVCSVPAFTTVDLFGSYKFNKSLEINGSVSNLFDKIAAFDPQASYGQTHYNPSYSLAGAIGRYFRIGLKYRFQ